MSWRKNLFIDFIKKNIIISVMVAVFKVFLISSTAQRIHMSKGDLCPVTTSEFSSPVTVNGQENITCIWSTNQTTTERILHAASMNLFWICVHTCRRNIGKPLYRKGSEFFVVCNEKEQPDVENLQYGWRGFLEKSRGCKIRLFYVRFVLSVYNIILIT